MYETLLALDLDFDDAMMLKGMLNAKANEIAGDMANKPQWRGADNQVAACGRLIRLRKLVANLDMLIDDGQAIKCTEAIAYRAERIAKKGGV